MTPTNWPRAIGAAGASGACSDGLSDVMLATAARSAAGGATGGNAGPWPAIGEKPAPAGALGGGPGGKGRDDGWAARGCPEPVRGRVEPDGAGGRAGGIAVFLEVRRSPE